MITNAAQPRASLHTLGCRLNQAETAVLSERLRQDGYRLVAFGQPTDLLVLNTCSVTQDAERTSRYLIRKTLKHSPKAFIAVTGCYAQTGPEGLKKQAGIDLIVTPTLPCVAPRVGAGGTGDVVGGQRRGIGEGLVEVPDESRQIADRVGLDQDLVVLGAQRLRHDPGVLELAVGALDETDAGRDHGPGRLPGHGGKCDASSDGVWILFKRICKK